MTNHEHIKILHVRDLRTAAIVLYCCCLGLVCYNCKSSRTVSQSSTTERLEVFDSITETVAGNIAGFVNDRDSSTAHIKELIDDTIRIERDTTGRPILIIRTFAANYSGFFGNSKFSDIGFTGLHTSTRNQSAGTVDHIDQKEEERATEINPVISIETIIGSALLGMVIIYLIYILISDIIWPRLKKSIFSRRSNK